MSDTIRLSGLRVRGNHGVFDFERRAGQDFVIDIELTLDLSVSAATDELADTVDYGTLADRTVAIVAGEPVNLLETLAGRIAQAALADDRVQVALVTVHKPQAPISHTFDDVAVSIRRARGGSE